jgi:hypothetical protein
MSYRAHRGLLSRVLAVAGAGALTVGALTACSAAGPVSGTSAGGNSASGAGSGKPVAAECLVGTWSTTIQTYNSKPLGGAGQVYTFNSNQTTTLDYTGSGPVSNIDGNGSIQYSGTSTWKISNFASTSSSAGTFTFTLTGGTVTADNGGDTSTLPSSGSGKLAWNCEGNTATLTERVPSTSDAEAWTLKRTNK